MPFISVQIVRFVDDSQPGWVENQFVDAFGRLHIIVDKVPVMTVKDLDANSEYPTQGSLPCEILRRYRDEDGRELLHITTTRPAYIESKEGLYEFTVLASLLTEEAV